MKSKKTLLSLLAALAVGTTPANAQAFRSGSNGSYGPINTGSSTVTLDVPPDGIFHATTINVPSGGRLLFRRNALNTPVYLLATGDVTINGGTIDVSGARGSESAPGLAGPGGFDGGAPGSVGLAAGDGQGPGGGKAGTATDGDAEAGGAGYATTTTHGPVAQRGATYGSPLLLPIVGGSGGGGAAGNPGWGGGGGGGAILIASDTRIVMNGSIFARGGQGLSGQVINSGSGGAVRLVAPVVSSGGSIDVRGDGANFGRGDGRIRVDTLDRSDLRISFLPNTVASVGGLMVVFPDPLPRLDIVEAAGRQVPLDTPTQVLLPTGSPAAQSIRVRARDFGQVVPIRVVLTPDSGPAQTYDAQIDNAAANPAETSVNVTFPLNVLTHVHVFTR